MSPKKIAVVTGGTGFVGSHLIDLLIKENFHIKCLVRKTSSLKWIEGKGVEIVECSLTDKQGLLKVFKDAEYIYHVAGVVKSKTPQGYFDGNVETTRVLLDAASEYKDQIKRFVIVSSQTATGPSLDGKPVNEESPCNPITTYGKSKLAEEELAKTYFSKIPITITRAPAVYGERDTEIFIFFNTFSKGLMTTIGFDKKVISLINVIDLVNGIYLASVSDKAKNQIYFISSEKYYTWDEVGDVCNKVFNKKPIKVKVPHSIVYVIAAIAQFFAMFSSKPATLNLEKARDITRAAWICDTSKAMKDFGYRQNLSLEAGIKRTVDWYKEMKWL
jgi:nucleoside-diphosphate-sugar epimerase